jgi:DHA1 family bicyclomycin/chloramphenicol resistance-like MFS transporter
MPEQKISSFKLIAMLAMMTGIVAFSIDGILPGMPVIANELSPQVSKKAQEVLVFFILGMGLGTYLLVHFQMLLAAAQSFQWDFFYILLCL